MNSKTINKTSKKTMSKKMKITIISSSIAATLIILFLSLSFCFGIFGPTSYSFSKTIKPYINTLNSINSNSKSYISKKDKKEVLNVALVKEKLETDIIDKLIKLKKDIQTLNFPEKLSEKRKNLCSGIESNILIYKEIRLIATTINPKELSKSIETLKNHKKNTKHDYQLVKDKNFLIEFPTSLDNMINTTVEYAEDYIEQYNKNSVSKEQKKLFLSKLNDISDNFYKLLVKNNYISNVNRILTDTGSLDEVLLAISKDRSAVKSLKVKLSEISIPEDNCNVYYSLENLLKDYDLYLQNLNHCINTEKLTFGTTGKRNENLTSQYDELIETFKNINTSYGLFHESLLECML